MVVVWSMGLWSVVSFHSLQCVSPSHPDTTVSSHTRPFSSLHFSQMGQIRDRNCCYAIVVRRVLLLNDSTKFLGQRCGSLQSGRILASLHRVPRSTPRTGNPANPVRVDRSGAAVLRVMNFSHMYRKAFRARCFVPCSRSLH